MYSNCHLGSEIVVSPESGSVHLHSLLPRSGFCIQVKAVRELELLAFEDSVLETTRHWAYDAVGQESQSPRGL